MCFIPCATHENVCNYIHLPVQSGNSRILDLMNRTYDREWYQGKIDRIYELMPDCAISSDVINRLLQRNGGGAHGRP